MFPRGCDIVRRPHQRPTLPIPRAALQLNSPKRYGKRQGVNYTSSAQPLPPFILQHLRSLDWTQTFATAPGSPGRNGCIIIFA